MNRLTEFRHFTESPFLRFPVSPFHRVPISPTRRFINQIYIALQSRLHFMKIGCLLEMICHSEQLFLIKVLAKYLQADRKTCL